MSDTPTIPRPWSDRQREAVRSFVRHAAVRAQKEAEIQNRFAQRNEVIAQEFAEAEHNVEEEKLRTQADNETAFENLQQAEQEEYQRQVQELSDELYTAKKQTRNGYAAAKSELIKEFKDSRWTTNTLFEADKKVAKDHMTQAQRRARKSVEKVIAERKAGYALLKQWQVLDEPPDAFAAKLTPGADPWKALDQCAEKTSHCIDRLKPMRLPRYIRGIWPHLFLVFIWALATSPALTLKGNEWIFWVLATSATIIPLGLWARTKLIAWMEERTLNLFEVMHQAVADARAYFGQCVRRAKQEYKVQKKQLQKRTRVQLDELSAATNLRLRELRRRRSEQLRAATEKYDPMLFRLRRAHEAKQKEALEQHQHLVVETKGRFEEHEKQINDRHRKHSDENNRRHAEEWTGLALSWKQTCTEMIGAFQQVDRESRAWFGAWDPAAHPIERGLPSGLRFGTFAMSPDQIPNGIPDDAHLVKPDFSSFTAAAFLPFPEKSSLLLEAHDEGRRQGLRALETILLRTWLALPPGKLRCTFLDPVGRGEHFAAFMHLVDNEPALVGSRIWTEPEHIEERLADLTAHMETILQKFLRNQFQSLAEYNAQAGEVAEPFRFLVVAHFPTNFSPEAAKRLLSLASAGARCGIYTFILADQRQPLPHGITWDDLERACTLLTWHGDHFALQDEDFSCFPLTLDEPPSEVEFTQIVKEVGARAVKALKVEVPFTSIAPTAGSWWTEDSRAGLSVPLGRAGANRLQHLTLGLGTSQHVLIAGKTGSGKSTLLHVLIMQLALRYSPAEVELYLIDFKKGVEFKTYAVHALPHARVVAVESEREFGLSVLHRLDAELVRRGELYRKHGVTDLASYRNLQGQNGQAGEFPVMPRIVFVVDEFQEFFVEDDKIAQESALLFDRLVRQGRAFGMHILLGSQTLGGAYSLARTTIDQMAVRIALQCSEADAHLILSRDNTEARLLSRPGEAIYNSANGMLEGNSFFQIVWLNDDRRDDFLKELESLSNRRGIKRSEPLIVFEGNVAADMRGNPLLLPDSTREPAKTSWSAWLGDAVALKEPTRAIFRRQSGSNLVLVGQQDEAVLAMYVSSILSLAASQPGLEPQPMVFAQAVEGLGDEVVNLLPEVAPVKLLPQRELPALLTAWTEELDKRIQGENRATPRFLFLYGLHRLREVRKPDDDFGFSRKGEEQNPYRLFLRILREGPPVGLFTIVWCDTAANLQRYFDRQALREFEMRVLFQMSANDSSTLMDTPIAGKIGPQRAIFYTEDQGKVEKFRPYALPPLEWLRSLKK